MRTPARTPKYFALAVGIGALAVAALLLATRSGSAEHDGGYLEFSGPGSGFMEVADDAALNPANAITVEAWVYLYSYDGWGMGSVDDCPIIVGKNWEQSYALGLGCGGDVMDSFVNAIEYYENTPTIPLNTWTHVAMTYDGTTRRNLQNGVAITDLTDPVGPVGDTADSLRIGNDVSWDFSPNGRIDDVRIWNIARSETEVTTGMSGVADDEPGLVAQWTFDGGSLVDSAGGFTGTLVGDVHIGSETPGPTPTPTPTGSPVTGTSTPVPVERPGDQDCDGEITIADVPISLRRLAITPTSPRCEPGGDDANCDGEFDALDPLATLYDVAEVESLPVFCPDATRTAAP